ncbi:MAG TPA: multidrug ABC transporter permease [Lachnospiraceae bacterium]|nr:multidrug ABC transporter permease [Lachnospiraceae bacterium]
MLLTCIKTEQRKLRHSYLWLVFLVIPVLPAFMGAGNYLQNQGVLQKEWYSLWTQCSLFYSNFFYGPLVALYCAYIWRVEHLNHNWNQLMTMPVPVPFVFLSKLFLALGCTVFLQLWMWVLFVVTGRLVGLSGMPPVQILVWLLRGSFGGMGIAALQLVLSMVIRSFAVPIALALMGSVTGLLVSNKGLGLFWPYSLMLMGMNSNKDQDIVGNILGFGISAVVFFVLFTGAGIRYLKKRDICAG